MALRLRRNRGYMVPVVASMITAFALMIQPYVAFNIQSVFAATTNVTSLKFTTSEHTLAAQEIPKKTTVQFTSVNGQPEKLDTSPNKATLTSDFTTGLFSSSGGPEAATLDKTTGDTTGQPETPVVTIQPVTNGRTLNGTITDPSHGEVVFSKVELKKFDGSPGLYDLSNLIPEIKIESITNGSGTFNWSLTIPTNEVPSGDYQANVRAKNTTINSTESVDLSTIISLASSSMKPASEVGGTPGTGTTPSDRPSAQETAAQTLPQMSSFTTDSVSRLLIGSTIVNSGNGSRGTDNRAAFRGAPAVSDPSQNTSANDGQVLGANDKNSGTTLSDTAAIAATPQGWKIFGIAWFWWIVIAAAVVAAWLLLSGLIRRRRNIA